MIPYDEPARPEPVLRPFIVAVGMQTVVVPAASAAIAFISACRSGLIPTDADHIVITAADRPLQ
jgi:hypothetical protein